MEALKLTDSQCECIGDNDLVVGPGHMVDILTAGTKLKMQRDECLETLEQLEGKK